MLIDETERTFKLGQIVTATVTRVIGDIKIICRLENSLNAVINKSKIFEQNSQQKLENEIKVGQIITGRIDKICTGEGEGKFEVELNCKQADLEKHDNYIEHLARSLNIDTRLILDEDKKNLHFTVDQQHKNHGRFIPRRIAHEKFKNISSKRA